MAIRRASTHEQLVAVALAYPGASEDFPWGEQVAKVNKKIFAFLGAPNAATPGVTLKLPLSSEFARSFPGSRPAGYGLGRAGWVTLDLSAPGGPDLELLFDWLEESYRAVAPKRLAATLVSPPLPDREPPPA